MKTTTKYTKTYAKKSGGNSAIEQNITDATDFHAKRMVQKTKTESNQEFANTPTGNDEFEQSIAENVASTKIAENAFLIAKERDFAPGNARSDWLQAETKVEDILHADLIDRRGDADITDRRNVATKNRRISES